MFGKTFESMYTGSMRGAGAINFAVWGYIITHAKPHFGGEMRVELNPDIIGFLIGEKTEDIASSIEFLMSPDPKSRSKNEGGRRLVKIEEYLYRVVNGAKYRAIKVSEVRREQNRLAQNRFRKKHSKNGGPQAGERRYVRGVENGTIDPASEEPTQEEQNGSEDEGHVFE